MKTCTMCGKEFDLFDDQLDISIDRVVSYGSVHDGERVRADFCCECFDRIVNMIVPLCKTNPISEAYD